MILRSLLITCFVLLFSPVILSQNLKNKQFFTGQTIGIQEVRKRYLPPPEEFKGKGKGALSDIRFQFNGLPSSAVTAMNYAAGILESVFSSSVPITISVNWVPISTTGVLANSRANGFYPGWEIDAQVPLALYPVVLAEKITGFEINGPNEPDIILNINSNTDWYTGIDGKPETRFDLVTVAMHEICHGLGFFESFGTEGGFGGYGISGIPLVYDTFVENVVGQKLTNTNLFQNPSSVLRNYLQGDQLYFKGNIASNRLKLYAPGEFEPGSSISHFDEVSTATENSLMTPFIAKGEALHNPGPAAMKVFGDLGWVYTRLIHEQSRDTEEHLLSLPLELRVVSDSQYDMNSVGVEYYVSGVEEPDTIYMTSTGRSFTTSLPVNQYETEVSYSFFLRDNFTRVFRLPSLNEFFKFSVYIGTDTVKPEIEHTPEQFYLESVETLVFNANATDNAGIDTTWIEYFVNDGMPLFKGMSNTSDEFGYKVEIPESSLVFDGGDTLFYRILTVDIASSPNITSFPATGYQAIPFERLNNPAESYSTAFEDGETDLINIGFTVSKPQNFDSNGLHSKHPYESPEESGDSIGYISIIRTPVIMDDKGMIISFRTLALVEPGEAGAPFGSPDFFDYVVFEGSNDFGKSWHAMADGFDCSLFLLWEEKFNSDIVEQNSFASGSESLMERYHIFPKAGDTFETGDTIIFRFRLFSDPYAYGWGWAIDDLKIGPLINNIADIEMSDFTIYPNPGNGLISVTRRNGSSGNNVKYSVFDIMGKIYRSDTLPGGDNFEIDISDLNEGLYLIVLHDQGKVFTFKYSLAR